MRKAISNVNIVVNDDHGSQSSWEISSLSVGFGLHQAWIYTAIYSSLAVFNNSPSEVLATLGSFSIPLAYLISNVVFILALLFAAITDQKFLKAYTSQKLVKLAVFATSLGTFAYFGFGLPGALGVILIILNGLLTGVGSAFLLIFWGVAFSRKNSASIVINTGISLIVSITTYILIFHVIPIPFSGIATACLPLLQLPLVLHHTPVSYAIRREIPIFSALPINKVSFSLKIAASAILYGYVLGAFSSYSLGVILPSLKLSEQLLTSFLCGTLTTLLLLTIYSFDTRGHWDFLFRPLIPIISLTLLCLPQQGIPSSSTTSLIFLTGFVCFEAVMWIYLAELSQEFRFSPIFIFGIGRALISIGKLAAKATQTNPVFIDMLRSFQPGGPIIFLLLLMIISSALTPRVRDIKRAIKEIATQPDAKGPSNYNVIPVDSYDSLIDWNKLVYQSVDKKELLRKSLTKDGASSTAPQANGTADSQDPLNKNPLDNKAEDDTSKIRYRYRKQCEVIANRYLLSARETEVLFLLAKGNNAEYIQNKLFISKSTAKTHIYHIYRKLDIHTQQDLLLIVENARSEIQESQY